MRVIASAHQSTQFYDPNPLHHMGLLGVSGHPFLPEYLHQVLLKYRIGELNRITDIDKPDAR